MFLHIYTAKGECFSSFDLNCFSILDSTTTKYQTNSKEDKYIDWEKPNLNKQKNPTCLLPYQSNQFYRFCFFVFISEFIKIILIAFIMVDFV